MAAPKTKTTANTNHPLRARFDLRNVIDQSLILGEDFQRMLVTTLATFSQRHAASGAVQKRCCQRIFKDLDPLAKGQLFSIVNYPQL